MPYFVQLLVLQKLSNILLCISDDFHKLWGSVTHLHDTDTRSVIVQQFSLNLQQNLKQ